MKGLLLKDFYCIMQSKKSYIYVLALGIFFAIFMKDGGSILTIMLGLVVMMAAYTTFTQDDQARWPVFAATLPVKGRTVVGAKYILLLASLLATIVASLLVGGAMALAGFGAQFLSNIFSALFLIFFYLVGLSIILPLIFKFNVEKIRYIGSAIFMLPYLAFLLMQIMLPSFDFTIISSPLLLTLALPAAAVLFFISYLVSVKIYRTKEF